MIRVITDRRDEANALNVWVVELLRSESIGGFPRAQIFHPHTDRQSLQPSWEMIDEGCRIVDSEPSYRFDLDHLPEIITALTKQQGPSDASHAHLTDTIAVRDRLLTLIERGWGDAGVVTVSEDPPPHRLR